jgi:HTH-type transcriptional regulator/antitoxin HigA
MAARLGWFGPSAILAPPRLAGTVKIAAHVGSTTLRVNLLSPSVHQNSDQPGLWPNDILTKHRPKGEKAVKVAVDAWFHEVQRARWRNSAEVKQNYGTASIMSADRVVFNIKGNDYRLVAAVDCGRQIVFIKWMGSHRDYDKIDAGRLSMEIKLIRKEADHEEALREIERLWGVKEGTAEGDRLDVLATLVQACERKHFPMDAPDPIEPIRFRLEQQGLDHRALIGVIGSRSRVYEVMHRKRVLSLEMIRRLNKRFGVPAEVLIRPVRSARRYRAA